MFVLGPEKLSGTLYVLVPRPFTKKTVSHSRYIPVYTLDLTLQELRQKLTFPTMVPSDEENTHSVSFLKNASIQ